MSLFPFRARRRTLEELEDIRANRSTGIHRVIVVAGIIFLAFVVFLASMLILPPMLELKALQKEKAHYEALLKHAQETEREAHDSFLWMSDPEYFEQIARDRANLAKDGEIVIRRPSKPGTPVKPAAPASK